MEAKHTLGPWRVGAGTGLQNQVAIEPCIGAVYGAGGELIADATLSELHALRVEMSRLLDNLSPWVSIDEMCIRYDCTTKTLSNMERDGRLPFRKNGRWNRAELVKFESKLP